jgi:hypothetical protein
LIFLNSKYFNIAAEAIGVPKLCRLVTPFCDNDKKAITCDGAPQTGPGPFTPQMGPARLSKLRPSNRVELKSKEKIIFAEDSPEQDYGISNADRRMKEMLLLEAEEFRRNEATVAFGANFNWF